MNQGYVVELQQGCWLAEWSGDPGRTLVLKNGKWYPSQSSANRASDQARRYKPYLSAKVQLIENGE